MAMTHTKNPTFLNPKFAKEVFDHARHPKAWLTVASRLRSSADAIFQRENPVAIRFWDELHRVGSRAGEDGPAAEDIDESKFPFPNFDAAYMLMAFAIENLLKGILVAKGLVTFSKQEVPAQLRTHDLRNLHKLAAPKATIPMHVLDSLTYMSDWRARYPLPLSAEKFWPMHDDGTPKSPGFSWPDSHSEFLSYYESLEIELRTLL